MISKDLVTSDSCFRLANLGNSNADLVPGEILRLGKGRLTVLSELGRLVLEQVLSRAGDWIELVTRRAESTPRAVSALAATVTLPLCGWRSARYTSAPSRNGNGMRSLR
jgi:hypothetical protein